MLETTIKAVLGISLVVCVWLTVQMAWQRVFAKSIGGEEPAFDRCGGCRSCSRSACDQAIVDEKDRFYQAIHGRQPINQEG